MRVYIGPYTTWWGPYQIADLLKKVGVSDDKCNSIGEYLCDTPLLKICMWIHEFKSVKRQVKVHDYDTWNLYNTLAVVILPALKKFRKDMHGAPGIICSFGQTSDASRQICFDFYEEGNNLAWKIGHETWEEMLDKMIWSFEQLQPDYDWEDQFHSGVIDFQSIPIPDKVTGEVNFYEMVKGPNDTHVFDSKGYDKHYLRIIEGLELFGKYYMHLWD